MENMNNEISVAPYAPLLVYKKGYTPEFVRETIRQNNLKGLRIFAHLSDQRLPSLDFLKDYDFLEALHISSVDDAGFGFLKQLPNLKELSLSVSGNNPIDLSNCSRLEQLFLNWRKNITGIEHCKKIKLLSIYDYKGSDLTAFRNMTEMATLIVKTCGIQTLEGIGSLVNLEKITIANCRKLTSVHRLNGLKKLESLSFDSCSKVTDFTALNDLPALKALYFTDCKQIDSIKFIDHFPLLEEFGLLGNTVIGDGDTTPAKRVRYLAYAHKKHYNEKIPTPLADEQRQRSIAKAKEIWNERLKQ